MKRRRTEVAFPRDAINKAGAREKSIRHGHPSTLRRWWARGPLAAARAVIFAQMVDDPSACADTLALTSMPDRTRWRAAHAALRTGTAFNRRREQTHRRAASVPGALGLHL